MNRIKSWKKYNEGFAIGHGGWLTDKSTLKDKIRYRIKELDHIRFQLGDVRNISKIDEDDIKSIGDLINKFYDIINNIKNK